MSKWSLEFKVGLFTLMAMLVMGYMFFILNPDFLSQKKNKIYYTTIEDAGGIVTKTHVKTNGVSIGKVKAIELQINQTRIEIEILSTVKIPVGSTIAIKEKGLLGDVFMEIIRTEDKGVYVKDGDFIPPALDQYSMSKLLSVAGAIGKDLKKITASLSEALGGEEGTKNLVQIINDIKDVAHSVKEVIADNKKMLSSIITDVHKTTSVLGEVVGDSKEDLKAIVSNIRSTTADLKEFSKSLRTIMRDENKQKFEQIIANFDQTMNRVKSISEKIDNGTGTIGRLISDGKVLDEFQEAVKDVRSLLSSTRTLEVVVDYHGELRSQNNVVQHYFNMQFRTRPDKYYLIGFSDLQDDIKETTTEDLTVTENSEDGSNPKRIRETIYKRDHLRINLQYARRWDFAQIRFGLFESTGGIASDFILLNDRVRFTVEAFDWRKSPFRKTAHFKSYLSVFLSEHFYTMLGVNDITRLDFKTGKAMKTPDYFVSGGVNFTDQDLKTIFGTVSSFAK